ncbi:VanZ family protein [Azospirillum halopraeferens]|uniref:VanZ family protein n=1 Tax=Azospirillum halopraeferens TaxID=34010 RepID=UPI000417A647|nr:VanZ family protein [Azospirillum halopraeferens]
MTTNDAHPAIPAPAPAGDRRLIVLWLAGIAGVAALALPAGTAPPGGEYHADKLLHVVAFAGLSVLPALGFARRRTALLAALTMIPFGAALEVAQAMVPGRSGSVGDVAANTVGTLIGIAAAALLRRLLYRDGA